MLEILLIIIVILLLTGGGFRYRHHGVTRSAEHAKITPGQISGVTGGPCRSRN